MRCFDRICVHGETLEGEATLRWAEDLVTRENGEHWARDIQTTLKQLVLHNELKVSTSGTTGSPREIIFSAEDLVASARLTQRTFDLQAKDTILSCLPAEFVAGKMMFVRAAVIGCDMHVVRPRREVLNEVPQGTRYTFTAMIPMQLKDALMGDRSRVERQFETILLGGGPVDAELVDLVQGLSTHVFQGFGSTETLTHIALRKLNGADIDVPVSRPYHALSGITFGVDSEDALIMRTPHLFTKEHRTRDRVELIDDTSFRWLGRLDHMIISGGVKIDPESLEQRTCSVIPWPHFFAATPHDTLGECVQLVIETDVLSREEQHELIEKLKSVLPPYAVPKKCLVIPEFVRTPIGKIARQRTLDEANT